MYFFVTHFKLKLRNLSFYAAAFLILSAPNTLLASDSEVLTTPEAHRHLLETSIKEARDRLVIASPYLSSWAINEDKILELIEAKQQAGIKVTIYTDRKLDHYWAVLKANATEVGKLLNPAYTHVRILDKVQTHTLIKDKDLIVIGSFNWLSAVRNPESLLSNLEQSLAVRGAKAEELIETSLAQLHALAKSTNAYSEALVFFENACEADELEVATTVNSLIGELPLSKQVSFSQELSDVLKAMEQATDKEQKETCKLQLKLLCKEIVKEIRRMSGEE
ncbi:phospholipase D-like domain-containing protein [Candidatus Odyssella thessalonicensis]|uniref:phospholipase D-like domain-containing protein n=1 Tax=Candidatus Odyssella thessalonicensis TaxID=84647 RepID=UPI000225AC28|nr:phospholipase D-like domain-containing protein [Candidatus Odyssella thessalonicensis]